MRKIPSKMADLVVTSVNPTSAPDAVVWCSDPKTSSRMLLLSDYLEIISMSNAAPRNWNLTPKQSAASTRRVVAQMKQRRLYLPSNGFLYLHEMRLQDGYRQNVLDILKGCNKYNVLNLLLKQTLVMV